MTRNGLVLALSLSVTFQLGCGPATDAADGGSLVDAGQAPPSCNHVQQFPCFEYVWVDGAPRKMRFFDDNVKTNPPTHDFFVTAPQTDDPQGTLPFHHDHIVAHDLGEYWHGYLVLCTEQGLTSGACTAAAATAGSPPLAATMYGQRLKTVEAIEIARSAGLLMVVDTAAVLRGTVDPLN